MYTSIVSHSTVKEAQRLETEPIDDIDHLHALINARKRLMQQDPKPPSDQLTNEMAERVLRNRAAKVSAYTLEGLLTVTNSPFAEHIIEMCYEKDYRKFPVALGLLRSGNRMFSLPRL